MKKKVRIPKKADQLIVLALMIRQKHLSDGDASVLKPVDWASASALIDETSHLNEKALELKRQMKEFYQRRDSRFGELTDFVRSSRDILTGYHLKEMKAIGQWGFDVLDYRTSKSQPDQSKPAESK